MPTPPTHLPGCLRDDCVFERLPQRLREQAETFARVRRLAEQMAEFSPQAPRIPAA